MTGQRDDGGSRCHVLHGPGCSQAIHGGHGEIEYDDVGLQRTRVLKGDLSVGRLRDDLHVLLRIDQEPQAVPDGFMILGDQDADGRHVDSGDVVCSGVSVRASGDRRYTVVPCPGDDSTSSVAPTSSARSFIPTSPNRS